MIHNNSIKTSVQGLSPIIPDFKTKDIHLGKGAFTSSHWQSHSTRSQPSPFSLFSVPSARRLFAFSTLLSLSRSMLTGGAQYVGSNGGEARSKVSLCLLSRERIKAGRLLRNGHKVCSLPAGCKEPERERERELEEESRTVRLGNRDTRKRRVQRCR